MGLSTVPAVNGATVGPGPSLSGFADMRRRLRAIFVGSAGNLVEYYDFYAYAAFALYFAKSFCPEGDETAQQLNAAMLFAAGATQRLGKVQDGTSVLDYEPEEIKHRTSISTAFHSLSWKKFPFELIDTPGYAAFLADSVNCMRAFGGAVFVLNPSVGFRVESERLWATANDNRISRLLFVSKMDHEQANAAERIEAMLQQACQEQGLPCGLVEMPVRLPP